MLKLATCVIGAGLLAGSATVATAGDLAPEVIGMVMATCGPDYHRLCSFVHPGDGRIGRCLLDREPELAPLCAMTIKLAYAMDVCMPDYRRFCSGVPAGGGRIVECLSSRIEWLAPECQRVVSANAPYAAPGRERYGYGGPAPGAFAYTPRPPESAPYPARPYDDRYADHAYPARPYGDAPYPEERGYPQPGEDAPLK